MIRQLIAGVRQPRHQGKITQLGAQLRNLPRPDQHPYDLNDENFEMLLGMEAAFREGGAGLPATVPDQDFIYRLSAAAKVRSYSEVWRDGYEEYIDDERLFGAIHWQYRRTRDWIPLREYADGSYRSRRQITWWTSLELRADEPEDVVRKVSQCGIPIDWINKWSLVLRCRVEHLARVRAACVPSVLDGFDSEIFHPTIDDDTPPAGIAIDLDGPTTITAGVSEFVLQPISVDQIDVLPVVIDDEVKRAAGVRLDARLRESLVDYYRGLERAG